MSCSGSSLPPVSLPRLFHAPLAPKPNLWKRDVGVSAFAARLDFRCRVQSRQLNSLSWMLLGCAGRQRHGVPIEWRGDETHTNTNNPTKPPYKSQHGGMNALAGRVCQVRVQNRNVQPLYFNHRPGHPLIISITQITIQSSQNAISPVHCMPSLSH